MCGIPGRRTWADAGGRKAPLLLVGRKWSPPSLPPVLPPGRAHVSAVRASAWLVAPPLGGLWIARCSLALSRSAARVWLGGAVGGVARVLPRGLWRLLVALVLPWGAPLPPRLRCVWRGCGAALWKKEKGVHRMGGGGGSVPIIYLSPSTISGACPSGQPIRTIVLE